MNIKVTQNHIDRGKPADSKCCPIALAVKETIGLPIEVGAYDFTICGEVFELPSLAYRFVRGFDRAWEVEPFEFNLEVPEHIEKQFLGNAS